MKSRFAIGLLLGVLLGGGAFFMRAHYAAPPAVVPKPTPTKGDGDKPAMWLLPKDFTVADIYSQPEALHVLEAPDTVTLHREGAGDISVDGHTYSSAGVAVSADDANAKELVATFLAPNAYTAVSACAFHPGVLVRFTRGGHRLDVLVCLQCDDILWILDGDEKKPRGPQAGLSDLGVGALRSIFHKAFPGDPTFVH